MQKNKKLTISLLVSTMNRAISLERLFKSIEKQTRIPEQIIVVDASSGDETKSFCENSEMGRRLSIQYLHSPYTGLSFQNNYGILHSKGDLILILDDDLVLYPDYVKELASLFEKDAAQKIGAVCGVMEGVRVYPAEYIGCLFGSPPKKPGYVSRAGRAVKVTPTSFSEPTQVNWVSGGLSMWRKELFLVDRFNLLFNGYSVGNDLELSVRVASKWELVVNPHAICQHLQAPGGRPDNFMRGKMEIWNFHYIFINDIPDKRWVDYVEYIWSRFGIILQNIAPLPLHPHRWSDFLWRALGNIVSLVEIISGKWNIEYGRRVREIVLLEEKLMFNSGEEFSTIGQHGSRISVIK
jgi:glycosyltransferase involved in cell wall biosynthesis